MTLTISILDTNSKVKASASGDDITTLVYRASYAPGDVICLRADAPCHVEALLEDSLAPTFGFLHSEYRLPIPFDEKRVSYSGKSFSGDVHVLSVRVVCAEELSNYRNLALNPLDNHQNTGLFPHATANVETRGESVFAARNAINGNIASAGHGPWPYESWGINARNDAEITIDFGRPVSLDKLVITLRADFPHDNWWKTATIDFSDGSSASLHFKKSGLPQSFPISPRSVTWLRMSHMIKNPLNLSPFPALIQLEAWGRDAACAE